MKKTAYLLLSVLCFGLVSCEDYLDTDSASYLSPVFMLNYLKIRFMALGCSLPTDREAIVILMELLILRIRRIPVWQIITGLLIIQLFLKNGMQFIRR